jgi:hypothetical protein
MKITPLPANVKMSAQELNTFHLPESKAVGHHPP